jgi:hypothetical protein
MARARPAPPVPGQLTLDDWADTMSNERRAAEVADHAAPPGPVAASSVTSEPVTNGSGRHQPLPAELLAMPEALLTRTHLRALGFERRAVDAIFRALPVVALPGYSRPMIRVDDYLELVERNTFRDDCVRPVAYPR